MLFRVLFAVALSFALISSGSAEGLKISANPEKSKIEFVGKKKDGEHSGGFKKFSAEGVVVEDSPEKSSLAITIDVESLYSDDEKLTNHLKNPDFFDVKKYPKIEFTSTKIKHDESQGDSATITGKLKLLGKEELLDVPVEVDGNDERIIVFAKFKLDRTKWGMTYGAGNIEKDVLITATLHFDLKQ